MLQLLDSVLNNLNSILTRLWHYMLAYGLIGVLWRWLEWEFYGVPNPNGVDTIIGIIAAVSLGENYHCWQRRKGGASR